VPAVAVIPAPKVYIKVVVVKKLVVEIPFNKKKGGVRGGDLFGEERIHWGERGLILRERCGRVKRV